MLRLRLVKVFVQPVFVLDDGDSITEIEHPTVAIPASEWSTYSSKRFPAEVRKWQRDLNNEAKAPKPTRTVNKSVRSKSSNKPRGNSQ